MNRENVHKTRTNKITKTKTNFLGNLQFYKNYRKGKCVYLKLR